MLWGLRNNTVASAFKKLMVRGRWKDRRLQQWDGRSDTKESSERWRHRKEARRPDRERWEDFWRWQIQVFKEESEFAQ